MASTRYKLLTMGQPIGDGVTGAMRMAVAGVAKRPGPVYPRILVNEVICNRIAQILLLPCPPGALTSFEGQDLFFSLDFNASGQSLPPIDPAEVISFHAELAWGIILFDVLIMNPDRHAKNISFDTFTKALQIFDHSHALTGENGDPLHHLTQRSAGIAINLTRQHCLASAMTSTLGLQDWFERVMAIPDYYLRDIVKEGAELGLDEANQLECLSQLKARRDNIKSIVSKAPEAFPSLPVGAI